MYSREIDGEVLTLASSGWTYDNTFVLFDIETESMWYHLPGTKHLTGISGQYADRVLPELTSTHTRWGVWFNEHPQTSIMNTF